MSTFFLSASSFILLLMMAAWVSYWSKKIKIPATASLVAVGMLMAFWAKHHFLPFIDDFELTPDLLFYAFLPILLFESAYQIRYSELMRNIRSISALSIVSLVLSAFFIAVVLRFVFWWIGIEIPFIVSLLFGALISSTDTAAALSIFKEIGVPRRLNLIFEWESLFNDGTAIALFLVVLSVLEVNSPAWPIPEHVNFYTESIGHFGYLFGSFFPFFEAQEMMVCPNKGNRRLDLMPVSIIFLRVIVFIIFWHLGLYATFTHPILFPFPTACINPLIYPKAYKAPILL